MNYINSPLAPQAIGPYSQAVVFNGLVFCTGQVAMNQKGVIESDSVEGQTEQVLSNLKHVLEEAGSSLGKVLRTTVFVKNMQDFAKINAIYGVAFGDHKPARSTVEVSALPLNSMLSIDVIAAL
ncbi:Rid family detoxifying hydrolase [Marinomonas sp. 2405UD68-3]|uniref:Rid family detoxifying hydrolase n=1 Tax=Marinomonas sp. 2405UD68-3 TaxID=3391835 RepID=UPI0039C947D4